MPQEGKDALSIPSLPDLDAFVIAAGGQQFPLLRPRETIYPVCMLLISEYCCPTAGSVPELYRLVLACGSNQFPIRRPDDCCDLFAMAPIDEPARTGGSLEDLNKGVVTG